VKPSIFLPVCVLGLDYLNRIKPGGNLSYIAPYVTSADAQGIKIGAQPYQNNLYNQSTGNYGPYAPAPSDTQTAQAAPAAQPPISLGGAIASKAVLGGNTPVPTTVQTNNPTPLDDPNALANRSHVTPDEALNWYNQNIGTDAVSARQEFAANGNATNRNIVMLKNGVDQPVHSQYILQNPGAGGWQSDLSSTPNPTLAAAPGRSAPALAAAAAAPVAQQVQQNLDDPTQQNSQSNISPLLAQAINPAQVPASTQPSPAQVLDQGDPQATSALISQLGGPQWAGTNRAPQAPVYKNAPWLDNQTASPAATPYPPLPPVPQYSTRLANPSDPNQRVGPATLGNAGNYYQQQYGMSGNDFGRLAANPNRTMLAGPAETEPVSGIPSQKYYLLDAQGNKQLDAQGQPISFYKDPDNGLTYTVMNRTPYHETRVFPNGATMEIDNKISEESDRIMMEKSLEAGTAGPNWQGMTRDQKTAAFRMAIQLGGAPQANGDLTTKVNNTMDAMSWFSRSSFWSTVSFT
jgi:hypothetical protein